MTLGNSPTGTPYDNGEAQELATDDWCQYPDDGEDTYYTTCIKPEHIADWRDCAKVDDLELSGRLLETQRQLALVQAQLYAKLQHLGPTDNRIHLRNVRLSVRAAESQIQQAIVYLQRA